MKLATPSADPGAVAELRRRHRGPVIGPDDDGYETARATFNGLLDRLQSVKCQYDPDNRFRFNHNIPPG